MLKPFLRTAYNYDTNEAGDESGLKCLDKTLAQQHFRDETDINTIVERFHITGELPTTVRMPTYADFGGPFDFQTAMNAIRSAEESFAAMPANVRARFHNNPAEFVDFCDDPENLSEARRLGLVPAAEVKKAPETEKPQVGVTAPPEPPKSDPK